MLPRYFSGDGGDQNRAKRRENIELKSPKWQKKKL